MTNTSISNLTAGGAVSGTDLFPDVQTVGVGPVKVTATQIKTFIVGAGSVSVASGKTLTVNNTLTLSGTDGTTMTFPSTSATLAGLGIANVFTQPQTFQPSIDGQAGTFRRLNGTQTSNILELQTEANAFLAGFDKSGLLTLGAASTQTGILKMAGTTSGTVSLSVADAAGTWTMKLPNSGGTNGFILTTDGSGNTSWTNPTSLGIDLDVGSTAITNGTAGRLLFEGTGNVLQESANLFWDNTNGRLGIGTSTPTTPLTVIGQVFQSRTTGDNQAYRGFVNSTNNSYIRLENTTGSFDVVQSNAVASITVNNSNPLTFLVGGSERMRITSDGNVGIGVTPGTNTSLSIGNAPTTGLNSFGVNIDYAIQSSATVAGTYLRSVGSVVASHTLPTLRHYYATQGAFGAGSTVTNQFGFFAENSLTGATNNFGFFSNIASGTGRWNFYANGTADNYFAGNVGIGTSSISEKLTVIGNISTTGSIFGSGTLLNMTNATSFFPQATMWNQTSDANAGYYILQKSRGASGAVQVNDFLGTLIFKGYDASGNAQNSATVAARATAVGASSVDASLSLVSLGSTGLISFTTNGSERMRIRSDGYIGIGGSGSAGMVIRSDNNITGATTGVGLTIRGTIQSDVTSLTSIFQSFPSTQATSFTLSQLIHYAAEQNTFGIGSTVTEQRGFSAGSSLTGATNNYGFFSNIASGSGRWNFYANGTANNAFAGNSRFGGATAPVATVDVTGSVAATTTIRSSGATSGIGYATGAGGTVTQGTSRTTGVTIDKVCGQITLFSAAGSTSWQSFTVTNSAVASTDTIIVNQDSGTDLYQIFVTNVAAGSFRITFATTGGTTTEQPVFGFSVIKAVAA